MSRGIIVAAVAVAILVLTGVAYLVGTSRIEKQIRRDLTESVAKAEELLVKNASLEGLHSLNQVEQVVRNPKYVAAATAEGRKQQSELGRDAFEDFKDELKAGDPKPDVMALLDKNGDVVAELEKEVPVSGQWKQGGKSKYRSIELALSGTTRMVISEIWDDEKYGLVRVGVAPIVNTVAPRDQQVVGAVVLGYSIDAATAKEQSGLLRAEVAYFYGDKVRATSVQSHLQAKINDLLASTGIGKAALEQGNSGVVEISVNGTQYLATAGRLENTPRKPLPADYGESAAGAIVLMSLSRATKPLGFSRMVVLMLGIGALVIALLGITLTTKRIMVQVDHIEVGINEIINGNLDKTFRRVGTDLDGLANGLNVMLARLLGRPEPGEEEYDEDGNIVQPSALHFDTEDLSAADSEIVALAREPEPDYYKRIYTEYITARENCGEDVEGVSYESFVAKLRLNEGNLKGKYNCEAVRFKVVEKDGKVTLKPVPIV